MAGVLVVGGLWDGAFDRSLLQAAGAAAPLARSLGVSLMGALIGPNVSAAADAMQCGLEALYIVEGTQFAPYTADAYVRAARAAIEASGASTVVIPHGGVAREWVPQLAARLQAALVMNCCAVSVEDGQLIATKPVNGGSVLAQFDVLGELRIVTVDCGSFECRAPGQTVALTRLEVPVLADAPVKVLSEEVHRDQGGRLKEAKKIVAGGRGIGGPQHWHWIEEVAAVLDASVACSRPVADSGWVPSRHQVGLSGTTVAPDLYIAVGISGAPQHLAGITGAKTVVAINTEAGAEIFKRADWGVVDDYKQVLRGFTERVALLRG
ncbi:MAG: electron transfer flavoprotein subunit alpha/FixB family protein [Betaproteobacteria bacterium]|nr:electron transfer flavoprotein subunit alpha/FixB family protein [Betaproteobacteria bacterium]